MRAINHIHIILSLLLCTILAWSQTAHAQTYTLADTALVNKLLITAADTNSTNPTKSMQLSEQAATIAQKINYTDGYVRALASKGLSQCALGKPDNGLNSYLSAVGIAEKNGLKTLVGRIHMLMGSAYDDKGEYTKASAQFDLSLKSIPRTDSLALSAVYSYMGIMMSHMQDYGNSIEYMLRAINSLPAHHSMEKEASMIGNIAAIYIDLKNYNKAFKYLYRAVAISDSLHSKENLPVAYMNLGLCYDDNNQKDSALYYYFKSLALFQQTEDIHNEAILLNDIGTVYFESNKWDEAAVYYKKSLAMARKSSNLVVVEMNYNNLSRVYYKKGDYKTSADYKDAYNLCRDTLYSNESLQAIADLTTKYETEEIAQKNTVLQKENDLQKLRLREKNILVYSLVGVTILSIIIGFLLVRQNRLKNAQQKMELEQKQLLAQINPHFIFNCLNSIQQFVVQNDIINANRYLADFALLMRQTLDNSKDGIISLQREIEYLENYLSFEHMRFEDKFTYTVTADENIDTETVEIPSMIIQPFVENAVRHGLCNLQDRKGILKITFYKKDGFLYCSIDDNGIGMAQAKKIKEQTFIKYQSLGMELTRQRLALVSKLHSEDYKISIIHKENASQTSEGTTIIIKFPLQA